VDGILIGKDLAAKLHVATNDSVSLTMGVTLSPAGLLPRTRRLRVVGLFSLGLFELDSTTAFLSLDVARRLLGKDQVDLIQLRVDDIYAAPQIAASIPSTLGSQYITADWAAMEQVAVLGARAREDGHLAHHRPHRHGGGAQHHRLADPARDGKASRHRDPQDHGRQRAQRDHDFHDAGLIIGIVGTTVGASAGYVLSYVLTRYKLIRVPVDVYQVSYVPFRVLPMEFALVIVAAVLVCFIATIYPAARPPSSTCPGIAV